MTRWPSSRVRGPSSTGLYGREAGTMVRMSAAGKPPKLKFKPGTLVKYGGLYYEIVYCYRTEENRSEWLFALEHLRAPDEIGALLAMMGAGSTTPRIVYDVFKDGHEAWLYFKDIPLNGDRAIVSNKTMIQKVEIIRLPGEKK